MQPDQRYRRPEHGSLAPGEQIRLFLETLYGEDDFVELRMIGEINEQNQCLPHSLFATAYQWAIDGERATRADRILGDFDVPGGFGCIMEKNERGFNVYVGVNPRRQGPDGTWQGKEQNVLKSVAVYADVDAVWPEQVEETLALAGLRPGVIVVSNEQVGGCHVYCPISDQKIITWNAEGMVLAAMHEELNRRFISIFKEAGFKADDVQDLPRVLRLPGVVNIPDKRKRLLGRVPSPCVLHSRDLDVAYSVEELDHLLPPLPTPAIFLGQSSPPAKDESPNVACDDHTAANPAPRTPLDLAVLHGLAQDEKEKQAIACVACMWARDDIRAREPRGIRNCRDMRLLANDFDLGVKRAIEIIRAANHYIENDPYWEKYLRDNCNSPRGWRLEMSDEQMLEIEFVPKPNLPKAP